MCVCDAIFHQQEGRMGLPPQPELSKEQQRRWFIEDPVSLIEQTQRTCGDIFTLNLGVKDEKNTMANGYWVFLTKPDHFRDLFKASPDLVRSGAAAKVYFGTRVSMGGLARLDGKEHIKRRRFLMPVFHGKRVSIYFETMRRIVEKNIADWPVNQDFQMIRKIQKIAIDIIIHTVFGLEEGDKAEDLASRLVKVENADYSRDEVSRIEEELSQIIFQHIDEMRANRNFEDMEDVCSMLMKAVDEDGDVLHRKDIHDELISMLKAGFATVSTTLTWLFECILSHPRVLDKVKVELAKVLGNGMIQREHLEQLPYLEAAMMESMRFRPLAAFNGVRLLMEPLEIDGYEIPAGAILTVCSYLLHRRPEIYPEPGLFEPDRFLETKVPPYTWLPFGGGNRTCIGKAFAMQEMKIAAATILSKMDLRMIRPVTRPVWQGLFLSPEHGLLVERFH